MFSSFRDRQFEDTLRDGISAAKTGEYKLAQILLNRAILLNGADARPYVWLSATTQDPREQREYLEKAVFLDPNNMVARRGLALLTGKIDQTRLMPEGSTLERNPAGEALETNAQTFSCSQCGGRMSFSVSSGKLTCEYCGYFESGDQEGKAQEKAFSAADLAETSLDFVVPTTRGHLWAETQHRLVCERCGATSILPAGQKTHQCAYCGSNHLVDSPEHHELVDPQVILLVKTNLKQALRGVREWLGKGLLVPDNLVSASWGLQLRPAYYSCWTFDGTVEVNWSCEVREGGGRYAEWAPRDGSEIEFFNDVLVSGVRALPSPALESIEPFNLRDVQEFKPDFLAGWPTMIYDRSLADASLLARERVIKKVRSELSNKIETGCEKRDLHLGGGNWSGMTFKHILLPIYNGTYRFQGKEYQILVNGQTGKVGGQKPRDAIKLFIGSITAVAFVFLLLMLCWLFSGSKWPF